MIKHHWFIIKDIIFIMCNISFWHDSKTQISWVLKLFSSLVWSAVVLWVLRLSHSILLLYKRTRGYWLLGYNWLSLSSIFRAAILNFIILISLSLTSHNTPIVVIAVVVVVVLVVLVGIFVGFLKVDFFLCSKIWIWIFN